MISAFAFATPAATVPTPTSETNFTDILACGFTLFKSWINCSKSSIEYISWCGGGDIKSIPGIAWRTFPIFSFTFLPGSLPPSPGFAPWAIFICISLAFTKYSVVTPNRPDATCFVALIVIVLNLLESSPPSPVFERPPNVFIAVASVSWASLLSEPKLIAPLTNRLTISDTGSTSSKEMLSESLNLSNPRIVHNSSAWLSIAFEKSLNNL